MTRSADAPTRLRDYLDATVPNVPSESPSHGADVLASAAATQLHALLDSGDQSRETALDVLAIDALVTYALEMATADPASLDACAVRAMQTLLPEAVAR